MIFPKKEPYDYKELQEVIRDQRVEIAALKGQILTLTGKLEQVGYQLTRAASDLRAHYKCPIHGVYAPECVKCASNEVST